MVTIRQYCTYVMTSIWSVNTTCYIPKANCLQYITTRPSWFGCFTGCKL